MFSIPEDLKLLRCEEGGAIIEGMTQMSDRSSLGLAYVNRHGLPVHSLGLTDVRPIPGRLQAVRQLIEQLVSDALQPIRHGLDFLRPVGVDRLVSEDIRDYVRPPRWGMGMHCTRNGSQLRLNSWLVCRDIRDNRDDCWTVRV